MDDIQLWIYLVFGAIWLISRIFKKNNKDATPRKAPRQSQPQQSDRPNKPVSFEDLLKEFTEGKTDEEEEIVEEQPEPVEARQILQERRRQEVNTPDFSNEGNNRRFSDEESRRIYEESIKRAEGSKLDFKRDEHFRLKLKDRDEEEDDTSDLAGEISGMLQNPEDARKAVILSEILTRKY